ncbi:hypothetical protein GGX14DRAFT_694972 [Mycena pura]|uniref:Uncharacterized protein n=1 Tax=Mycena pura TaxID=153505 RepID=A0AAD6VWY1_9AGAR|nr:hypothetical protein GGX14DRAFT_694972 [Mycena pura]
MTPGLPHPLPSLPAPTHAVSRSACLRLALLLLQQRARPTLEWRAHATPRRRPVPVPCMLVRSGTPPDATQRFPSSRRRWRGCRRTATRLAGRLAVKGKHVQQGGRSLGACVTQWKQRWGGGTGRRERARTRSWERAQGGRQRRCTGEQRQWVVCGRQARVA